MQRTAASSTRAADRARVAEIAGEVAGIARELEYLGERLGLSSLQLSVQALRSEEANIRERLSSYYDPASILPTEIVSEIFVHVLPAYPICPSRAGKSSPTQLTHVCRQWREIALSTPSLWRAIMIPFRHDMSWDLVSVPTSWDLDFVQTWLRRSGSCPLSLHMDEPPESAVWSATRLFETIVSHRARWENLSLYLWNWCSDWLEIAGPMPLLREMKLDASRGNWNDYPRSKPLPTVFYEMPRLHSMTFVDHISLSIGFPWSQLTSLSLVRIVVGDCTELFQQTVNLVHCKVCPIDVSGVYGTMIEPDTRLPRLESLELVQDDGPPDVLKYLGTFTVAALLRLQIPNSEYDPDHFFHSLSAFIAKAGCKLQELHIIGPPNPYYGLARYRRKLAYIPRVFYNEICLDEEYSGDWDSDETSDEE
ncbi:hypothetical protein GGX14DRAFT_637458 [Mycena pura]|uniref:F-box domain-containing protein n=1 Tax=Mycena pura TaxID=153505 RepID=A0AAD6VA89_9AGAR|nr:hypothetical protein GGX14DRAFT_637458 [Mycena pura]